MILQTPLSQSRKRSEFYRAHSPSQCKEHQYQDSGRLLEGLIVKLLLQRSNGFGSDGGKVVVELLVITQIQYALP